MRRPALIVAALVLGSAPAAALDMPARKTGLWDVKLTFEGKTMPPHATQHCIDAETDKMMSALGGDMGKDMCPTQDIKQSGGTLTIDSICNMQGRKTTSHAVVTGDFNSAYTVKVSSQADGAPTATAMIIDAKWLGACKPDQNPGDIIMGNGMKMNIRDMQRMMGRK